MTAEEKIKENLEVWKKDRLDEQVTHLDKLLDIYREYLYLDETEDIEVTLACLLDREIPGDPVWLQYIAPSGDKKTEILRSFSDYSKVYTIDSLTTKTLVSGLTRRNKDTDELEPVAGLLTYIDGKVLVIKDFSTTLGKSEEYRTEFYGQLRNIYDGFFEAGFGTLPKKISVTSRIGLIAAATPGIDRYNRLENSLGTRFLKVRSDSDALESTKRALENEAEADRMRVKLRGAVNYFTKNLQDTGAFDKTPKITKESRDKILHTALYVAKMRASVWAKFTSQGDLVAIDAIDIEKPTRLAKQFQKLGYLLAIIRDHDEITDSEISTIQRVARDTAEPSRQCILDAFKLHGGLDTALAATDIDFITKKAGHRLYYRTVRNELELMDTLNIVEFIDNGNYRVTEEFKELAHPIPSTLVTSKTEAKKGSKFEVTPGKGVPSGLKDKLEHVIRIFKEYPDEDLSEDTILKLLEDPFQIPPDEGRRLLGVLLRDGTIFSPRPGYYKLTGGAVP